MRNVTDNLGPLMEHLGKMIERGKNGVQSQMNSEKLHDMVAPVAHHLLTLVLIMMTAHFLGAAPATEVLKQTYKILKEHFDE